ncbi:MAG: protease inhibitor I42 family protein [Deltaproteobacteria bacterium]
MEKCSGRKTGQWCRYVLFLGFLALVAIQPGEAAQKESATRTASVKKPFTISVTANPSTGYQWDVKFDKTFLALRAEKHRRDSSKPKNYVGVGGTTTFVFVPLKAGETTIKLQYKRPWEKKAVRFKTLRVKIVP